MYNKLFELAGNQLYMEVEVYQFNIEDLAKQYLLLENKKQYIGQRDHKRMISTSDICIRHQFELYHQFDSLLHGS